MYDESCRALLLMAWLGVGETGAVNDDLVSNSDFD